MSALPPLLLTYSAACEVLGYGRTKVWELTEKGELLAVGKGRARRISAESLRAYVRRLEEAARSERGLNDEGPCVNRGQKGDRE